MRSITVVVALLAASCRPPGYGKEVKPDAAVDAPPGGSTDAGRDAASLTCMQSFRLDGHGTASSVYLTGSFVNWAGDPPNGAVALTLGQDGGWTVMHTFEPGKHQYKFIVNGNQWIADPANPNQEDDGFGGKNSIYTCVP